MPSDAIEARHARVASLAEGAGRAPGEGAGQRNRAIAVSGVDPATAKVLRPSSILGVGVTGHRPERLASHDLTALHQAVAEVLAAVEQEADAAEPTRIRLVSALAEGADSIVADEALKRGWMLDAVLPFARDDFVQDFEEGTAREAHVARVARAEAVLELPGDRTAEDGEVAAYERAGRVMLAQSDILVAVWDGGPVRGRGGAAQIVAEAVLEGVPVIRIDPAGACAPQLLWDGLEEVDLGQQTVDTVARGGLDRLDQLLRDLLRPPAQRLEAEMLAGFGSAHVRWRAWALAYPLLLAVTGVRRLRASDVGLAVGARPGRPAIASCAHAGDFGTRLDDLVAPRFAFADTQATRVAQLFRSGYVANFTLAAVAVVLALLGLVLPTSSKPVVITLELATIGTILLVTHAGRHSRWHRRWLDLRTLAERLRGLALSAQLGDLGLRVSDEQTSPWVAWYARAAARELGLPHGRADDAYLACVRSELLTLIDDQIGYMATEERRMHALEHRLHLAGTLLFAMTALACVSVLVFRVAQQFVPALYPVQTWVSLAVTIISAAFPAIGAAIYGIRMQGDFGGAAARSERLRHDLLTLRRVIDDDVLSFDTLSRRVGRAADLLAGDLTSWLRTYHARPLSLPG